MKLTCGAWCTALLPSIVNASSRTADTNANHIFNAVHSSMRQFGSSLNHNGMSFFLATVPEGTEFYHGTSKSSPINGTQWLAFEAEHALLFARPRGGPPPEHGRDDKDGPPSGYGGPPPGPGRDDGAGPPPGHCRDDDHVPPPYPAGHDDSHPPPRPSEARGRFRHSSPQHQQPLTQSDATDTPSDISGYLHTYRTTHALHLLYLDGQSAAKSPLGTLDTQDLILRPMAPPPNPSPAPPHSGPMDEGARAADLCALAADAWGGRIDGILRMEGGFEIILCDFAAHLSVVSIHAVAGPSSKPSSDGGHFEYYRAIAARYDGIGAERVVVDYDSMVSVLAHPEALGWDDKGRPRVRNDSAGAVAELGERVGEMVRRGAQGGVDWQGVVDMVVGRYADRIDHLSTGAGSLEEIRTAVGLVMRPFVDGQERDADKEVERCARQFWPHQVAWEGDDLGVAARAVREVADVVCRDLNKAAASTSLDRALEVLKALRQWLGWTTWKRCRGCKSREICFLPIWPVGSEEDFEQPRCVSNITRGAEHNGYWPGMGGPPRGGPKAGRRSH